MHFNLGRIGGGRQESLLRFQIWRCSVKLFSLIQAYQIFIREPTKRLPQFATIGCETTIAFTTEQDKGMENECRCGDCSMDFVRRALMLDCRSESLKLQYLS